VDAKHTHPFEWAKKILFSEQDFFIQAARLGISSARQGCISSPICAAYIITPSGVHFVALIFLG